MKRVAILESLGISGDRLKQFTDAFAGEAVFDCYEKTTDPVKLLEECKEADAVIIANMPFPDAVIEKCRQLSYIDVAFTGVDHVGLAAAREKGIRVSNASGYSNEAVSELVIGLALSLMRHIPEVNVRVRHGGTKEGLVGRELRGKTVGIIGYGKIGHRTGELFHAFGCRILGQCQTWHDDFPSYTEQVSQERLLEESDIVVLHCPLNAGTRGMINGEKLARMKPTAVLINVARGPVVVESDLVAALEEKRIAGAAVDVFDREPPLEDRPILHAPNTVLTPHVAFATEESMELRAEIVFDNLRAWLNGEILNPVL